MLILVRGSQTFKVSSFRYQCLSSPMWTKLLNGRCLNIFTCVYRRNYKPSAMITRPSADCEKNSVLYVSTNTPCLSIKEPCDSAFINHADILTHTYTKKYQAKQLAKNRYH